MISDKQPVVGIRTLCGRYGIAYFMTDGVFELQPVLFDDQGRQFYVTHASDDVVYREIPVGRIYAASGTEPITNLQGIIAAMPSRLQHFVDFVGSM